MKKTLRKLALISLCSLVIVTPGCTIAPKNIKSVIVAYDSTTPPQYDNHNAGLISYEANGSAILTKGAVDRYNLLVTRFAKRIETEKGQTVLPNSGVTDYTDQYGNHLYKMDPEHMVIYLTCVAWIRSGIYI